MIERILWLGILGVLLLAPAISPWFRKSPERIWRTFWMVWLIDAAVLIGFIVHTGIKWNADGSMRWEMIDYENLAYLMSFSIGLIALVLGATSTAIRRSRV